MVCGGKGADFRGGFDLSEGDGPGFACSPLRGGSPFRARGPIPCARAPRRDACATSTLGRACYSSRGMGTAKRWRGHSKAMTEMHVFRKYCTQKDACECRRPSSCRQSVDSLKGQNQKCFLILQEYNVKGASPPPSQIPHAYRKTESWVCLQSEGRLRSQASFFRLSSNKLGPENRAPASTTSKSLRRSCL